MRVGFLTHEPFFPPSGGGSAEAIYLVEEMVGRGHEVHLFCPRMQEDVPAKFRIQVHEFTSFEMGRYTALRNFKYLLYPLLLQTMVEREHARTPFDLILSQHAISAVAAGRLKQKLGIPVVLNFLDYLTGFMETWPRYLAPRSMLSILKRFELSMPRRYQVDGVMTVSDTLADYFASSGYPSERIVPIYYGYDASLFPFRGKKSDHSPEAPVIVMHGSLDHHHLRGIALRALEVVCASMPSATFRFVGHETDTLRSFRKAAEAKVPGVRIESTGFVPYKEVGTWLSEADLGIVPYEESTGTHCAFVAKIVEYLGIGLPVVSTRLKSVSRYFAQEPMITFTDFDGEQFGRAILERLKEPVDLSLAQTASQKAANELDWRRISSKAVDFVERIGLRGGSR